MIIYRMYGFVWLIFTGEKKEKKVINKKLFLCDFDYKEHKCLFVAFSYAQII